MDRNQWRLAPEWAASYGPYTHISAPDVTRVLGPVSEELYLELLTTLAEHDDGYDLNEFYNASPTLSVHSS